MSAMNSRIIPNCKVHTMDPIKVPALPCPESTAVREMTALRESIHFAGFGADGAGSPSQAVSSVAWSL